MFERMIVRAELNLVEHVVNNKSPVTGNESEMRFRGVGASEAREEQSARMIEEGTRRNGSFALGFNRAFLPRESGTKEQIVCV